VIARFRTSFPAIVNIIEHFDYAGVEHALREGRADIGFTYIPASNEFAGILRDEYVVLLPPTPGLRNSSLGRQWLPTR